MSVTQSDLINFHEFALTHIGDGGEDVSFLELAVQWQATRDHDEAVVLIRECIPDMESGIGTPLQEAADEIRRELGFPGVEQ